MCCVVLTDDSHKQREECVLCYVVLTDDSHKQREECVLWCGVLFLVCCVA